MSKISIEVVREAAEKLGLQIEEIDQREDWGSRVVMKVFGKDDSRLELYFSKVVGLYPSQGVRVFYYYRGNIDKVAQKNVVLMMKKMAE